MPAKNMYIQLRERERERENTYISMEIDIRDSARGYDFDTQAKSNQYLSPSLIALTLTRLNQSPVRPLSLSLSLSPQPVRNPAVRVLFVNAWDDTSFIGRGIVRASKAFCPFSLCLSVSLSVCLSVCLSVSISIPKRKTSPYVLNYYFCFLGMDTFQPSHSGWLVRVMKCS